VGVSFSLLTVASEAVLWRSYLRAVASRGQTEIRAAPARPGEAPANR
jgi:hypothetical protein